MSTLYISLFSLLQKGELKATTYISLKYPNNFLILENWEINQGSLAATEHPHPLNFLCGPRTQPIKGPEGSGEEVGVFINHADFWVPSYNY